MAEVMLMSVLFACGIMAAAGAVAAQLQGLGDRRREDKNHNHRVTDGRTDLELDSLFDTRLNSVQDGGKAGTARTDKTCKRSRTRRA